MILLQLLAGWLAADYQLYNKANSWLDKKLETMDQEYRREVSAQIEDADRELERKCKLHQEGSKLSGDFGMWSSTVVGFTPAGRIGEDEDAKMACMGELQFVDWLRERQMGK